MNPTPNELIAGIRSLLKDEVGPSVTSPAAVLALKKVMGTLRDVDWNEAGFALMAENGRLLELLARVKSWSEQKGQQSFASIMEGLRACEARATSINSFAEALELNRSCRKLLADFTDVISDDSSQVVSEATRVEWRRELAQGLHRIVAARGSRAMIGRADR